MPFDAIVTHPGRLEILIALARCGRDEFVALRSTTRLTDGNLASHARRLATAGLIQIDKQFRAGKPVTSFTLTRAGRLALESHVQKLNAAIATPMPQAVAEDNSAAEEWID
ncbi:MAG TPA: transcriptional regulator [Tepidisphaeraceae bacterium]|nr:transcriptional regulator [Tepidisphaeraceae bacterium]